MTNRFYLGALIAFCSVVVLPGCASNGFLMAKPEVTMLGEAGTAKSPTEHIDVFYTKRPEKSYEEIAKIEVGDTDDNWSIEQIKKKAREIGADGVIIIGRVGSYVFATGTGTSTGSYVTTTGMGVGTGYGLAAIAIRYK